jgi:tRNA(Leu) C34 or U34 (ribose-2'-O)-methylase TrmL
MKFRISQNWIYDFSERLLREAGIDPKDELDNFIYEAGERDWEEYEKDGTMFYFITYDDDEEDY